MLWNNGELASDLLCRFRLFCGIKTYESACAPWPQPHSLLQLHSDCFLGPGRFLFHLVFLWKCSLPKRKQSRRHMQCYVLRCCSSRANEFQPECNESDSRLIDASALVHCHRTDLARPVHTDAVLALGWSDPRHQENAVRILSGKPLRALYGGGGRRRAARLSHDWRHSVSYEWWKIMLSAVQVAIW